MDVKCEKQKCMARYFVSLFSLLFVRKVKRFCGLFFHSINKTRNSHEIWKCIESISYFVVCFVKTLAKCEKCIADLTGTEPCIHRYTLPHHQQNDKVWCGSRLMNRWTLLIIFFCPLLLAPLILQRVTHYCFRKTSCNSRSNWHTDIRRWLLER